MTSYYLGVIIFTIKKTKTAKNILNKKALATSTFAAAPALQLLQVKKQKYVYTISLISCYLSVIIFIIRKTKMANNLLDIKAPIVATSANILAAVLDYNID